MYWRAFHRAVGTVYTAVPRLGLQNLVTGVTVIEPLASIRWHGLQFLMATGRAGKGRFQNHASLDSLWLT